MRHVGGSVGAPSAPTTGESEFRVAFQEWTKDHTMFAAALEELAGQLAALHPAPAPTSSGSTRPGGKQPADLLQRVAERAPSDRLQAYMRGAATTSRMQRQLPEQLDQNLRLLSILAAEMRALVQRLEQLAQEARAACLADMDSSPEGASGSSGAEDALLMAAALDGAEKQTQLIEKAAEGVTLTTPPDEASAAATVLQLQPFLDATLLAALLQDQGMTCCCSVFVVALPV